MEYRRFENCLVLRLDPGEEICETIMEVCRLESVALAAVSGIGAGDRAEIGIYDTASQKFMSKTFEEPFEIVSIAGNVTEMDGEVYLHLHSTLADSRLRTWSGHLKGCRISATGEIILHTFSGAAGRVYDAQTGLNILHFDEKAAG